MLGVEKKPSEILVKQQNVQLTILSCKFQGFLWDEKGFNSMAEKCEEVLDSQKDAPIFSKWSATDEIKFT